jgi:hypothetical protein
MSNATANITAEHVRLCSLEEVLAYENDAVVYEFIDQFDIDFDEADGIFTETKKWLWLCAYSSYRKYVKQEDIPDIYVSFDFAIIDEMWHTFMLHSIAYTEFCNKYFGYYIDHSPTPPPAIKKKKSERTPDDQFVYRITRDVYKKQLEFIYDILGEETVVRWFDTFPDKYNMEFFKTKYVKWDE